MTQPLSQTSTTTSSLSDQKYNLLKSLAQVWLPGLGTLYFALAQIWNLPAAEGVVGTIVALDAFLGLFLSNSSLKYEASGAKYGGVATWYDHKDEDGDDARSLKFTGVDLETLETKDEITFRIKR